MSAVEKVERYDIICKPDLTYQAVPCSHGKWVLYDALIKRQAAVIEAAKNVSTLFHKSPQGLGPRAVVMTRLDAKLAALDQESGT